MKTNAVEDESGYIPMKIVVIGGSGLIGTKLVTNLRRRGHEVVAASPSAGVNTVTGEGLAVALTGAQVVVDVANAPAWEDNAVLEFFETSGRSLLSAETLVGVRHHVALSVVGTERLLTSGYFRAKMAQEDLIRASSIPFTIVRATQFFEFAGSIAQLATDGSTVRLPPALMQPIAADDVADLLAEISLEEPINGMIELAGPETIRQDELARQFLTATGDGRNVITDAQARYYGVEVNDQSLVPGDHPRIGPTRFRTGSASPLLTRQHLMNNPMTILGIAGSLRRQSYNRAALRAAAELMPAGVTLDTFELDGIPIFNEDDERTPPAAVMELKRRIRAADAILFVTPEYNYSVPAVLKNAIDWASRPYGDSAWDGKPAAIMGASSAMMGTVRAQYHLRQICVYLNLFPLNQPEVMIGNAAERFDAQGNLVDEKTRKYVQHLLTNLVRWTEQMRQLPAVAGA